MYRIVPISIHVCEIQLYDTDPERISNIIFVYERIRIDLN